jgi:hypothetical protein
MTNIVSNDVNFPVLGIEAIGFILVMYIAFYFAPSLYKKVTTKISDFKRTQEGKLEFAIASTNDKDYVLQVKNSGKHSLRNVKITWDVELVDNHYPNEAYKRFEDWIRGKKTLEWKGTKSDAITISKGNTKEAYIFQVHREELQLHLQAFKSEPLNLPLEDCTFGLLASALIVAGNRAHVRVFVFLGRYKDRITVNQVSQELVSDR